jgi:SAM-dependent methyltransferase
MTNEVSRFFDREAEAYHGGPPGPMSPYHRRTARRLEAELEGDVLCIGGLWAQVDLGACGRCSLTVGDVSERMLRHWESERVRTRVCDALDLPFEDGRFDHLVYPLVLHHIAGKNGRQARRLLRRALAEAHRVLKPGGGLWISEFTVSRPVYWLELAASPVTHAVLGLAKIPLVVMHSAPFYRRVLAEAGFSGVECAPVEAEDAGPFDALRPVIGLPWLVVPRFAYPVTPTLITARR